MESQAKTQLVIQAKTQANNVSIKLPPCGAAAGRVSARAGLVVDTDDG